MMLIYCDHNATTPLRSEVLAAMMPFLTGQYGNASSVHALGSRARCAVEEARAQVADLLGAAPASIVFTSGGTESNNLAIQGAARAVERRFLITTPIEHASVRESVSLLQREGYGVRLLPVDQAGRVRPAELATLLAEEPAGLVSIAWANNEIGTIQPIEEIVACCHAAGALLHVDAVQAAGKIPVHVGDVDLLSISAHKLGGPKGVGALYVRPKVALSPLLVGGGQERGRRAGTENVAGTVGLGVACGLAAAELAAYGEGCLALREMLWAELRASITGVRRNSPEGGECLPNTLHLGFDGVRGEALVAALDLEGVAVSSGSACAAGAGEPSHVLLALGRDPDAARNGVRFSLGRNTTKDEVEEVARRTIHAVQRIRGVKQERADA